MSHITYHRATPNDTPILVENRILFAIELNGEGLPETIENLRLQMTAYFSKAAGDNSCISYIARADGEVAGIGSLHIHQMPGNFKNPSGKWGYVMNMYTLPAFRRRGICSEILKALLNDGCEAGITAFELHATKEGEYVYKKDGFQIHTEPTYRKYI